MPGSFDEFELNTRINEVANKLSVLFMTRALPIDDPRAKKLTNKRLLPKAFYLDQLMILCANIHAKLKFLWKTVR